MNKVSKDFALRRKLIFFLGFIVGVIMQIILFPKVKDVYELSGSNSSNLVFLQVISYVFLVSMLFFAFLPVVKTKSLGRFIVINAIIVTILLLLSMLDIVIPNYMMIQALQ